MKRTSLITLGMVVLTGCTAERSAAPVSDTAMVFMAQEQFNPSDHAASAPSSKGLQPPAWTEVAVLPSPTSPDFPANMIVRTATASIEVDSLEAAVAALKQLAAGVGGYVGGAGIETGKNQLRRAFIEVKIPAARFDEVLSGLTPIGRLESVNVNAQDVGEEYVDVNARIENAKRLEQRLLDLLRTRTGKLKDVLDVEQSLAQVREEIERYEGRIRYLQAHAAMSTLSVTVHEPVPVVGSAGKSVMGEAFTQAWRNFVVLIAFLVQSLGVILPITVVAVAGWMLIKRVRLAKQRPA